MTTMRLRDVHDRQIRALETVIENPLCLTGKVREALDVDRHTARNVLNSLYIHGFVVRQRQLGNVRDWFWMATDKGHEAVERGLLIEVVA